jgi:UV DNA damage endonuclease
MTYGLTCISEILKQKDKTFGFKTITKSRFIELEKREEKLGEKTLSERIIHNLKLTSTIIEHCRQSEIGHYRLSSSLFPLVTEPTLGLNLATIKEANQILNLIKKIGETASTNEISLSLHPSQYNVLASERSDVVANTVRELDFQAHVLDLMGLPADYSNPINIHPSVSTKEPTDGNLKAIVDRFYDGMVRCNDSVLKRLVVENEDKGCWNCMNLFVYFHQYMGHQHRHIMPLTYDNLHDECNSSALNGNSVTIAQNIDAFSKTWPDNITPVFHWSNGKPDSKRSHADFADGTPPEHDRPLIWEVEVKKKDFAIAKLQGKTLTAAHPKKKAIKKTPKVETSVKKILKNIQKTSPQPKQSFNHLYGE